MSNSFIKRQRDIQAAYFRLSFPSGLTRSDAAWRLLEEQRVLNLAPALRDVMPAYFGEPRNIVWHRHASHGLSSQICCLNFLAPLATQPRLLSQIVGNALDIEPPEMLPVENGPDDHPWFVGFEWTGREDHLGEWRPGAPSTTRGANATSADAVVRFRAAKQVETLLIEWKYTENYSAPLSVAGNPTRIARYHDKMFAPNGPIRNDLDLQLEDFFWEPLYQLLRQQMLAWRMAWRHEDGADRVRVLHISPAGNLSLHRVTSPVLRRFGDDVFTVLRATMTRPGDLICRTTGEVFGRFLQIEHPEPEAHAWRSYLLSRYKDILG